MFLSPPLLAFAVATTNPAAGTVTTTTVIAAPGANSYLRIVSILIAANEAPGNFIRCEIRNGAGGAFLWVPVVGTGSSVPIYVPGPGYRLSVNTALVFDTYANVASVPNYTAVHYYIDDET